MVDDPREPMQDTPKGAEIPIPKRDDFLRDLRKVAEPEPERSDDARGPRE